MKKHRDLFAEENTPIQIYINRTENRIELKSEAAYYLVLLTLETQSLRNTNTKNVPKWQVACGVLLHRSVVNNCYQKSSRVFYTFIPSKSFKANNSNAFKNF